MSRKPTEFVQFKLRIREALRRKIEKAAEKKDISANAEAVERIERTFAQDEASERMLSKIEELQRQHYEEEAREKALYQAALTDSLALKTLVGGEENAGLIRLMVLGLGNNPKWAATPESRKDFADKVHHFIISVDLKGNEQ
jgi:hypothetical protein